MGDSLDWIQVGYEWKPAPCSLCSSFGHLPAECPQKAPSPFEAPNNPATPPAGSAPLSPIRILTHLPCSNPSTSSSQPLPSAIPNRADAIPPTTASTALLDPISTPAIQPQSQLHSPEAPNSPAAAAVADAAPLPAHSPSSPGPQAPLSYLSPVVPNSPADAAEADAASLPAHSPSSTAPQASLFSYSTSSPAPLYMPSHSSNLCQPAIPSFQLPAFPSQPLIAGAEHTAPPMGELLGSLVGSSLPLNLPVRFDQPLLDSEAEGQMTTTMDKIINNLLSSVGSPVDANLDTDQTRALLSLTNSFSPLSQLPQDPISNLPSEITAAQRILVQSNAQESLNESTANKSPNPNPLGEPRPGTELNPAFMKHIETISKEKKRSNGKSVHQASSSGTGGPNRLTRSNAKNQNRGKQSNQA